MISSGASAVSNSDVKKSLAAIVRVGAEYRVDFPIGHTIYRVANSAMSDVHVSRDGQRLAFSSYATGEIETIAMHGEFLTDLGAQGIPSWSSRGQLAYPAKTPPGGVVVVRDPNNPAATSHLIHGLPIPQGQVEDDATVDWSPDGRRLLVTRNDVFVDYAYSIWVENADGTGARLLRTRASDALWSPDGQSIVFNDGPDIWS